MIQETQIKAVLDTTSFDQSVNDEVKKQIEDTNKAIAKSNEK